MSGTAQQPQQICLKPRASFSVLTQANPPKGLLRSLYTSLSNTVTSNKYEYPLVRLSCACRIMRVKLREIRYPKGSHWIVSIKEGKRNGNALAEPK